MRSSWKVPFYSFPVTSLLKATLKLGRKRILTLPNRHIIIDNSMVTRFFTVPNGKSQIQISIQPDMVSHRFGEFVKTRVKVQHYRKKKQKAREKQRKEEAKKAGKTRTVDLARIAAMKQKRKSRK